MDLFQTILFATMGLLLFGRGCWGVGRMLLLRLGGQKTVASLTEIIRKGNGKNERYVATARWRDEDGNERTAQLSSFGRYLLQHINKPEASEDIYYRGRLAMLAGDKYNRVLDVFYLAFGVAVLVLTAMIHLKGNARIF
ncbi:MAG: hypothetical protein LBG83_04460 [Oscillospiraceae bacterium]|jgi:hypothetical protein|nr:hypothetical protein [Oscillospiraceae bacterium]